MKFGENLKRLAGQELISHCLSYSVLKKAIGVVETEVAAGDAFRPPESRFNELLHHELAKVNRFMMLQLQTLLDQMREAQRELYVREIGCVDAAKLDEVEGKLDAAAESLVALEAFRRLNFTGFRKIVKKFDKQRAKGDRQGKLASWFMPQLFREYFVSAPFDAHLLALAWGYGALRHHRRGDAEQGPAIAGAGEGRTQTFWLMPSARMRALCTLVKRFDLVLPATAQAEEVSPKHRLQQLDKLGKLPVALSTDTSLVYFDSEEGFPQYAERLKAQGPAGFRCRRAPVSAGAGDSGNLVELDASAAALGMHAFTPVPAEALGTAFPLGSGLAASAASARSSLAGEVSSLCSKLGAKLQPCATVGSKRLLLKGDTSATKGMAVALDEDVQFSRGPAGPAMSAPSDAIDFPYCLLEVAGEVASGESWLQELQSHAALRNVAGFAIGVQAVAALHKDAVPELPSWFSHLSEVESAAPVEAWGLTLEWRVAMADTNKGSQADDTSDHQGRSQADALAAAVVDSRQQKATASPPAKAAGSSEYIEPKPLLAAERTMLEWMHSAVMLALLGTALWKASLNDAPQGTLLDTSSTQNATLGLFALVLVLLALCFVWYSVYEFLQRLQWLQKNKLLDRIFNNRAGVTGFSVILGVALLGNLLFQLSQALDSQD